MNSGLYLRKINLLRSFTNNFNINKLNTNFYFNLKNITEKAKSRMIEKVNIQALLVSSKIEDFISSKFLCK